MFLLKVKSDCQNLTNENSYLKISRPNFHEFECTKGRLGCIVNVAIVLSIILLSFKEDLISLDSSNINLKLLSLPLKVMNLQNSYLGYLDTGKIDTGK